jgi:hypothetical protein
MVVLSNETLHPPPSLLFLPSFNLLGDAIYLAWSSVQRLFHFVFLDMFLVPALFCIKQCGSICFFILQKSLAMLFKCNFLKTFILFCCAVQQIRNELLSCKTWYYPLE